MRNRVPLRHTHSNTSVRNITPFRRRFEVPTCHFTRLHKVCRSMTGHTPARTLAFRHSMPAGRLASSQTPARTTLTAVEWFIDPQVSYHGDPRAASC